MDYYLWGAVESKFNEHSLTDRAALQANITQVMVQMDRDEVARACQRFRTRLQGVIKARGGYIE